MSYSQGQHKFLCPALKEGTLQRCNAEWPYVEVRRLAVLTQEEQCHFEETMAVLAAAEYCEHKTVSYWHKSQHISKNNCILE